MVAHSIEEILAELARSPDAKVLAKLGEMTVEVRRVAATADAKSAADVLREILAEHGPWAGETEQELLDRLAEARRAGGSRPAPEL